jgi:anti-anti-sigma regulatory factor
VHGDLCISSVQMLEACVLGLATARPGAPVIVDLRGVGFCDVTALRALSRIQQTARGWGVAVELQRSPAIVRVERLVERLGAARAA